MPDAVNIIFISYAPTDTAFVDRLEGPAVRKKQHSRKVDKCGTVFW